MADELDAVRAANDRFYRPFGPPADCHGISAPP